MLLVLDSGINTRLDRVLVMEGTGVTTASDKGYLIFLKTVEVRRRPEEARLCPGPRTSGRPVDKRGYPELSGRIPYR